MILIKETCMFLKAIGWILGFFTLGLIDYYFENGNNISALICVIAIIFFVPPLHSKLNNNAKKVAKERGKPIKEFTLKASIAGGLALLVLAYFLVKLSIEATEAERSVSVVSISVVTQHEESNST